MNPLVVCFSYSAPDAMCALLQKDFPTLLLAPFTTIDAAPRFWYGNNQGGIPISKQTTIIFQGHLEFVEFCNKEFWGIRPATAAVLLSFLAPYCVQDCRLGSKP